MAPERGRNPLRYPPCLAILCPLRPHQIERYPGPIVEPDHTDSCPPNCRLPTRENLTLAHRAWLQGVTDQRLPS